MLPIPNHLTRIEQPSIPRDTLRASNLSRWRMHPKNPNPKE